MSVNQENYKKAEVEAQAVWDEFQVKMDMLFDEMKGKSSNGLGSVSVEEKELIQDFNEEIAKIREKYGIEVAPKE